MRNSFASRKRLQVSMPQDHSRTHPSSVTKLFVRSAARLPGEEGRRGHVKFGMQSLTVALGRSGITHAKREGDRATPAGRHAVLHGYFRADRIPRPASRVPIRPLLPGLGWCDDPASPLYNRPHPLPLRPSHEVMWRGDGLYDLVLVLDYNMAPRRVGRGSAIFLHCAKPKLRPTLGCLALPPSSLRKLVSRLAPGATFHVL